MQNHSAIPRKAPGSRSEGNSTGKAHILIVDDESHIRETIQRGLQKYGYMISCAPNGLVALDMIQSQKFDAAIIDQNMPGLNGMELCMAIRSIETISALPIIMLTGEGDVEWKLRSFEIGIDDYMTKPFDLREIRARIDNLIGKQEDIAFLKDLLGKYVSSDVMRQIIDDPASLELGGKEETVSIMFADLRSFTPLCESLRPKKLVAILNRYFTAMEHVIFGYGGMVNKYIGDAILAIFGAPIRRENHALDSVRAAVSMQEKLSELNCEIADTEGVTLKMGIGIHSGPVILGNIGSLKRMEYTIIGQNVNVASRVEKLTKKFDRGILFTEETNEALLNEIPTLCIGPAEAHGVSRTLNIFTPEDLADP